MSGNVYKCLEASRNVKNCLGSLRNVFFFFEKCLKIPGQNVFKKSFENCLEPVFSKMDIHIRDYPYLIHISDMDKIWIWEYKNFKIWIRYGYGRKKYWDNPPISRHIPKFISKIFFQIFFPNFFPKIFFQIKK